MQARPFVNPRAPANPVLSMRSFGTRRGDVDCATAFDGPNTRRYTSGRAAIASALRRLEIGAGDEVLLPAFHCPAVVSPVQWIGARPMMYRVKADLSVDIDDLTDKLSPRSKALIVVHYFGFPQPMDELMSLAKRANVSVLEDCAHSMFSRYRGRPVGSIGDFAIASAMKTFPVIDGGYLTARGFDLPETSSGGLGFEMKALIDTIETANRHSRLGVLAPIVALKNTLRAMTQRRGDDWRSAVSFPASSEGALEFDARWIDVRMSMVSRVLSALAARERIVEARRRNYRRFDHSLANRRGARCVFDALWDDVVPYAYPLVVEDEARAFAALKTAGVPMFRWEQADVATCATSARYARHLFQFPCHQELTSDELDWMIETIGATVG